MITNLQMYFYQSIIINHCYLNLKSQNLLNNFHIKYSKKITISCHAFPKKNDFQCLIALNFQNFINLRMLNLTNITNPFNFLKTLNKNKLKWTILELSLFIEGFNLYLNMDYDCMLHTSTHVVSGHMLTTKDWGV